MLEEELFILKNKKKEIFDANYIESKFNDLLDDKIINQEIIKFNLNKDILDYQKFIKNHRENYEEMQSKIIWLKGNKFVLDVV